MISIFYRQGADILASRFETEFARLGKDSVLWIDLLSPTGSEKKATEAFLGTEIQSRATAEEIESSSRFSETTSAIFANTTLNHYYYSYFSKRVNSSVQAIFN